MVCAALKPGAWPWAGLPVHGAGSPSTGLAPAPTPGRLLWGHEHQGFFHFGTSSVACQLLKGYGCWLHGIHTGLHVRFTLENCLHSHSSPEPVAEQFRLIYWDNNKIVLTLFKKLKNILYNIWGRKLQRTLSKLQKVFKKSTNYLYKLTKHPPQTTNVLWQNVERVSGTARQTRSLPLPFLC